LGFAPLTSQLMTRMEIPSRPTAYQAGAVLPVSNASGVAVRYNRDIFVTEGATLSEFTPDGATVTLTPTPPTLQEAVGVAADFSGEAYVADRGAGALVPISVSAGSLALPSPIALTVDSGANILALTDNGTGFAYLANQSSTAWSDPVQLATGQLSDPQAIAAGPDGRIFVADTGNDRIAVLEITENGRVLHGDPGGGTLKAQVVAHWAVSDPLGVAIGPNAEVYVATSNGVTVTDGQGHDPITVSSAPALGAIGIDREGVVWVAESGGVASYKPSTPAVIAQTPPSPTGQSLITGADLNSMESQMLQVMQQYGFVGATLAISVNGRLVLSRGYGYSQRDSRAQTQTQPDMLFRLASCSKIFTGAAALLQLQDYEQDIASSDQPFAPGGLLAGGVTGYDLSADGFADSRTLDITLLNLLQMTAGLDTPGALYSPLARTLGGETPPATAVEILLHTFSNNVLKNAPGSTFVYSDVAYMTLGRWIEAVAQSQGLDETYATYVQTRLLAPLGITEMRIANTALNGAAPNEVRYYPYTGETCGQSVFTNSPEQVPATYGATYDGLSHDSTGGWIASATDLVVLANALAPEQTPPGFTNPLDAPRKALFKALPDFTGANRSKYYGAGGWFLSMNENGTVTSMNKDGGLPGTTTFVQYQRQGEDQVVFCYLLNGRAGPGAKRSSNARTLFQAPLDTFLASQAGKWPSGDLFP
jgi:CubicO group peptidase (beta-lactamase class C family)